MPAKKRAKEQAVHPAKSQPPSQLRGGGVNLSWLNSIPLCAKPFAALFGASDPHAHHRTGASPNGRTNSCTKPFYVPCKPNRSLNLSGVCVWKSSPMIASALI